MATAVLTTKGQVTIPLEVRKELGLKTGDQIEFTLDPATGRFGIGRKAGSILDLYGVLKYDGPPVSVEAMNQAIGEHLAEEDMRSRYPRRKRS